MRRIILPALVALAAGLAPARADVTLFQNVRVFDGVSPALSAPTDVLVRDRLIERVGPDTPAPEGARVIDGAGHTLMPGLIDAHTHLIMSTIGILELTTSDPNYPQLRAAAAAEDFLMRGFTTARDVGGPVFGLKAAIDRGFVVGPRIYPSGAMISQTSGHGDFRALAELPRADGELDFSERHGYVAIADGRDEVLRRVREQLMLGASQIKLMAGGGVTSDHDPLDVTQYTEDEMRAAVEAATA